MDRCRLYLLVLHGARGLAQGSHGTCTWPRRSRTIRRCTTHTCRNYYSRLACRPTLMFGILAAGGPRLDQAARWRGGKMRERWEDSTVVLTVNKRVENGLGSNKPVAPISRLLFSPREEPLVEGTIRRVGIQKAAGIQNADDVWVSRRCRCRLPVSRRAHSKVSNTT